jgi:two-component system, NarL family, response regulator LiaR
MKKFWLNILIYGASLGLLLVALQFFRYKWIMVRYATEWYAGLIALLFTGLGIWAGQKLTQKVRSATLTQPDTGMKPAQDLLTQFGITPREWEVLQLMAQGHSNQEIADQLFVSLNTVKTHISNVLSKLNAERRTQAVQKAKTLGLLP